MQKRLAKCSKEIWKENLSLFFYFKNLVSS